MPTLLVCRGRIDHVKVHLFDAFHFKLSFSLQVFAVGSVKVYLSIFLGFVY